MVRESELQKNTLRVTKRNCSPSDRAEIPSHQPSRLKMSRDSTPVAGPSIPAQGVPQIAFELATRVETLPRKPTRCMCELAVKPRVRGVFLRPRRVLQLGRSINQEAALGFTRGEIAAPACLHCQHEFGPFTECVTVTDMFTGSCTNCHYSSSGSRCSFRPGKYISI